VAAWRSTSRLQPQSAAFGSEGEFSGKEWADRCHNPRMRLLGEGPNISGSVVLIILLVLAAALVVAGLLIWQGCVMALRAGRGDRRALTVWAVLAVVQVVLALSGFVILLGPALVVQAGMYLRGRATSAPGGDGSGPATPRPGS
jgi:hypothetical protein